MAKKTAFLATAITFFAFVLRVARLDFSSLRGDEAFSFMSASWDLGRLFDLLATTEPQPPLYFTILHYWMQIAGDNEFSLRFPSVAFGVVVVPVAFALCKALLIRLGPAWAGAEAAKPDIVGDRRVDTTALLASLFVAVNPLLIWHSQDVRAYTMLAFLTSASIFLSLGGLSGRRRWASYVIVTYMAMLTHYSAFYVVLAENLAAPTLVLQRPKDLSGQARRWLSSQVVLAVAYLPWAWWAVRPLSSHSSDWVKPVDPMTFVERTLAALGAGTTVSADSRTYVAITVALVLVLALVTLLRAAKASERMAFAIAGFYLVVPVLLLYVFSVWRPMFDERHLVIIVTSFAIVASFGAVGLVKRFWPGVVLTVVLVGMPAVISLGNYFFNPEFSKSPGWRPLVSEIRKQEKSGDYILLNYPDPAFSYYYRGSKPIGMLPSEMPADRAETERSLTLLASSYERIWVVPAPAANWDADGLVEKWLMAHLHKIGVASFSGVRLALYSVE